MINPVPSTGLAAAERHWLAIYRGLSPADRTTLLAFAEFLLARQPADLPNTPPAEPTLLPAMPGESVIGAIKRLSASYPMLDRQTMLHETAALMTQHVVQGRAAEEVIVELEILFGQRYQQHYAKLTDAHEPD